MNSNRIELYSCVSQDFPEKKNQQDGWIDRQIYRYIYCKELAHAIMEADKSQDLQSKARDPGRADVSGQIQKQAKPTVPP